MSKPATEIKEPIGDYVVHGTIINLNVISYRRQTEINGIP